MPTFKEGHLILGHDPQGSLQLITRKGYSMKKHGPLGNPQTIHGGLVRDHHLYMDTLGGKPWMNIDSFTVSLDLAINFSTLFVLVKSDLFELRMVT